MELQINGKSFLECNEDDLKQILDDPTYRESEYIDYKRNFAILEAKDKPTTNNEKSEFRNDICSFANTEGGFLIYGIEEEKGIPHEIVGIDINGDNTDKFELDRKNDLQSITPRIPSLRYNFVKLSTGKYVVIMCIKHDYFAPYTHIDDQKYYRFYKRVGNGKVVMTYNEIRNMFNYSLSISKEILDFRKERIKYYSEQSETGGDIYSQYLLFHIIPDTFTDSEYDKDMFVLQRKNNLSFSTIFSGFHCSEKSIPCVNGIRFIPYSDNLGVAECYLYNNGVIECFLSLNALLYEHSQKYPNGYIPREYIWDMISETCNEYAGFKDKICNSDRLFLCLDIVGCKGVTSQSPSTDGFIYYTGTIDRNTIICEPVIISEIKNESLYNNMVKKLHLNYLLAIGVKHGKELNNLITELYP